MAGDAGSRDLSIGKQNQSVSLRCHDDSVAERNTHEGRSDWLTLSQETDEVLITLVGMMNML